ncbi:MAG: class I SAM-dependent methyltransferase [Syntrophobacteraceae bacterium]
MPICALCGRNDSKPVIREGRWQYFRCQWCGLVFLHPQPTLEYLDGHYQEYLPEAPGEIDGWRRMMERVHQRTESLVATIMSEPGRLLDVGCGYGFFLDHMVRRGWNAKGIEISATARHYGRERLRLDVSSRPLPRPDWGDATFDVVSLLYVIEHLPDPIAAVKEAHRLLRPGGLLVLRWPHTTPIARWLKPWASKLRLYQAPSHLFDFSPETITRLLSGIGFESVRHFIGGWTIPNASGPRLVSVITGALGETLARLSRNRFLLPGLSKTTLALRGSD